MANKHKGEIRVAVNGKPVLLVLDFNALCELEDVQGSDTASIVNDLFEKASKGQVSAKLLRTIIWASMLHDDSDATVEAAGEVANALGKDIIETVGDLFMQNGLLDMDGDPESEASGNATGSKG